MKQINDILDHYSSTHLNEMDRVKLMDRTDTKFTFHLGVLPQILSDMLPFYTCLEINGRKQSNYRTLYYDTDDLMLYNKHHNGELNRYKIRHRTYVDSNQGYLEVKFKNNKGRTIKERIKEQWPAAVFENASYTFLSGEIPIDPNTLKPVVWINYSRITLVSKQTAERVTIDLNLQFKNETNVVNLDTLVIAEIKQQKKTKSPFTATMKKMRIREGSISKYCFAIAFTHKGAKKNNFKEKILSLKHILTYDMVTDLYRHAG